MVTQLKYVRSHWAIVVGAAMCVAAWNHAWLLPAQQGAQPASPQAQQVTPKPPFPTPHPPDQPGDVVPGRSVLAAAAGGSSLGRGVGDRYRCERSGVPVHARQAARASVRRCREVPPRLGQRRDSNLATG